MLTFKHVEERLKYLKIQIQSVLDASLPNKQQHKAASSLIEDQIDKEIFFLGKNDFESEKLGGKMTMHADGVHMFSETAK